MNSLKKYERACDILAVEFCQKHYEEQWQDGDWVCDEPGGTLEINGDYWEFQDIVTALRGNITSNTLFEWYNAQMDFYEGKDLADLGDSRFPNLRGYLWQKDHPRKVNPQPIGWDEDPL